MKQNLMQYGNQIIYVRCITLYKGGWVMVFNATFDNISVISLRSVLLSE